MNVFDGQSTVLPRTSKNSSAARAAPVQLEVATDGKPFQPAQPSSNISVSRPSDHWARSSALSHSSWSRLRSRSSNPMAKVSMFMAGVGPRLNAAKSGRSAKR